jgi:hypothetical protein
MVAVFFSFSPVYVTGFNEQFRVDFDTCSVRFSVVQDEGSRGVSAREIDKIYGINTRAKKVGLGRL